MFQLDKGNPLTIRVIHVLSGRQLILMPDSGSENPESVTKFIVSAVQISTVEQIRSLITEIVSGVQISRVEQILGPLLIFSLLFRHLVWSKLWFIVEKPLKRSQANIVTLE